MKLKREFYRLPLQFDVARMQQEIAQFTDAEWVPHHENFAGNSAIPLISVNGEFNNDFKGAMLPTSALLRCEYLQQVIASFGEVIGRTRLMRLDAGCEVPLHSDINHHWYKRVRVHIPIVTTEDVVFQCNDKRVHMAAGDCWIFDSWKFHKVENNSDQTRIHLVVDFAGSSRFWAMVEQMDEQIATSAKFTHYQPQHTVNIRTEKHNYQIIMSPGEVELLVNDLVADVQSCQLNTTPIKASFSQLLKGFVADWRELWFLYGEENTGWPLFHHLRDETLKQASQYDKEVFISNGTSAVKILAQLIIGPSMNVALAPQHTISSVEKSMDTPLPDKRIGTTTGIPIGLTRNSPCHCGSGDKYKNCHGKIT
ncbi:aspartyl/asparaginyl beta-hydroxylase domain-containing protein [Shewanella glacialipiscicola]|uniref:aspartyl/asparaginyl beta-hydroxylase domain-containing protein n=1 Tax=Shewanella glacialipiscicola TaxID=614069 RepID=UPI0021DAE59C|nr:aspartyl/asparaginyl beta-hydroxylase domain-containing protein [Shewanella glacialipiscicola]MCU7995187.1 aspartyl/asparaginyl beta-hydroxylase domain-containing protein [Shewanella glacialipiscicola]MCU8026530.1 aspartyl/asparaginyl beta-hydroxylase domain-containing protein [Shewanella glacialipiscicola]